MSTKTYTMHVPAIFAFDVEAESEAEAHEKARKLLDSIGNEVCSEFGFDSRIDAPWVSLQKAGDEHSLDPVEIEVADVWDPDDPRYKALMKED